MDRCKLKHGSEFRRFRTWRNGHNQLDITCWAWGTQTAHTILHEVFTSYCVCYPKSCQIKHTQTQWGCQGNGFVWLQWAQLPPCPDMRLFRLLAGYQTRSCYHGKLYEWMQWNLHKFSVGMLFITKVIQTYSNTNSNSNPIETQQPVNDICHVGLKAVEYVKALVIYEI